MGDDTSLELYGPAYGIVLQWLSPNELASLRLCCRAWKFWVDLNLTQLVPFNAENSSVCSPFNVSRLTYRSRFPEEHTSHGSRIHSPFERKKGILSISRTFGHLTSITLDCTSKGCLDIQNLALLPHLTSCQLLEFPFKDRHAISKGVGKRTGLRTLVLHSTKDSLSVHHLECLTALVNLSCLALQPRAFTRLPASDWSGLSSLCQLKGLTKLVLMPAHETLGHQRLEVWEAVPGAAQLDDHASQYMSAALATLNHLQVLEVSGLNRIPPTISCLVRLQELNLEGLTRIHRPDVALLLPLKALTGLTLLSVAPPSTEQLPAQPAGHHNAHHHHHNNNAGDNGDDVNPAAAEAVRDSSSSSSTLTGASLRPMAPLTALTGLQQLVFGCVSVGRGRWGASLMPRDRRLVAHVCMSNFADMACLKGLEHACVEARGWHSACVSAKFTNTSSAVSSLLAWSKLDATSSRQLRWETDRQVPPPSPPAAVATAAAAAAPRSATAQAVEVISGATGALVGMAGGAVGAAGAVAGAAGEAAGAVAGMLGGMFGVSQAAPAAAAVAGVAGDDQVDEDRLDGDAAAAASDAAADDGGNGRAAVVDSAAHHHVPSQRHDIVQPTRRGSLQSATSSAPSASTSSMPPIGTTQQAACAAVLQSALSAPAAACVLPSVADLQSVQSSTVLLPPTCSLELSAPATPGLSAAAAGAQPVAGRDVLGVAGIMSGTSQQSAVVDEAVAGDAILGTGTSNGGVQSSSLARHSASDAWQVDELGDNGGSGHYRELRHRQQAVAWRARMERQAAATASLEVHAAVAAAQAQCSSMGHSSGRHGPGVTPVNYDRQHHQHHQQHHQQHIQQQQQQQQQVGRSSSIDQTSLASGASPAHQSSSSSSLSRRQSCPSPSSSSTATAAAQLVPTTPIDPTSATAAAAGVFANHPERGSYIMGWPHCLVLHMEPSLGLMPLYQRAVIINILKTAELGRLAQTPGSPPSDGPARRLLVAQHRSSMAPTQILPRLATATSLTRLDLCVDQHWPSSVLAQIKDLARLPALTTFHLDCGRREGAEQFLTGFGHLTNLTWLSLRWFDSVPIMHLSVLTGLRALQLKDMGRPPGAAELADVAGYMPRLRYLAVEGTILDAEEDFIGRLRDLVAGGRYTWAWVEHALCQRTGLQLLGSVAAALLLSIPMHAPRWPEMLATAILASWAVTILVISVAVALVVLWIGGPASGGYSKQPGAALRQLRYLSLRRCTVTHRPRRGGHGALLALLTTMPDLRFLDLMWLNIDYSDVTRVVKLPQLHYISVGKQQLGRKWRQVVDGCSAVLFEASVGMDEVLEKELLKQGD